MTITATGTESGLVRSLRKQLREQTEFDARRSRLFDGAMEELVSSFTLEEPNKEFSVVMEIDSNSFSFSIAPVT